MRRRWVSPAAVLVLSAAACTAGKSAPPPSMHGAEVVAVPDVINLTSGVAYNTIADVGLTTRKWHVRGHGPVDVTGSTFTVVHQRPVPGAVVRAGSVVHLTVVAGSSR